MITDNGVIVPGLHREKLVSYYKSFLRKFVAMHQPPIEEILKNFPVVYIV